MSKRILITGGAGFIGRRTANALAAQGHDVRVLDNLSPQVHADPNASIAALARTVEFIHGDVRDRAQVETALKQVQVVYHMAAETGVGQSMYEISRYSDVTIQGTAVLCDCFAKNSDRCETIILTSSRAVYGEGPYRCNSSGETVYPAARTEEQLKKGLWDPTYPGCENGITPVACDVTAKKRPVSIYGLTKKVQEELVSLTCQTFGIRAIVLRYFNVFGAGQSLSNPYTGVLSILVSRLLANRGIEIYEDGQMQRDFVSIDEVLRTNLKCLDLDTQGVRIFDVGSGMSQTILDIVRGLRDEIGATSQICMTGRYRIGDIRSSFADISHTQKVFGAVSKHAFEIAVRELIAWARAGETEMELDNSLDELSAHGLTGMAEKH